MHFQVYLPGVQGADAECQKAMKDAGLASLIPDASYAPIRNNGPDGAYGTLVSWTPETITLHPETAWVAAYERDGLPVKRYYVGFRRGQLPTPEELKLATLFEGYWTDLEDGNRWVIANAGMLPRVWRPDPDDSRPRLAIKAEFQSFFDESVAWYQKFREAEEGTPSKVDDSWFAFVVKALSMNYRMLPEVALHLGLFSTQNAVLCIGRTVAGPEIREAAEELKKTATADTPAG